MAKMLKTPKKHRVSTVAILGCSHSGSTIMGVMLGAHSKAFFVGEFINYAATRMDSTEWPRVHGRRSDANKRTGYRCHQEQCPVWGQAPQFKLEGLYDQLRAFLGVEVIIDSSKRLHWFEGLRDNYCPSENWMFILPYKTPQAFCVSMAKLRLADPRGSSFEDLIQDATSWRIRNERYLKFLDSHRDAPQVITSYERQISERQHVLTRIQMLIGHPLESNQLNPNPSESHFWFGNGNARRTDKVRLDDQSSTLSPEQEKAIWSTEGVRETHEELQRRSEETLQAQT